jgi:hypothetical protein
LLVKKAIASLLGPFLLVVVGVTSHSQFLQRCNLPTLNELPQVPRRQAVARVASRLNPIEANLDNREDEVQVRQCRVKTFRLPHNATQNPLFVRIEPEELLADDSQSGIGGRF